MDAEIVLQDNREKIYRVIKELEELRQEMEHFYKTIKSISDLDDKTFEELYGDTDTAYIQLNNTCEELCVGYTETTRGLTF